MFDQIRFRFDDAWDHTTVIGYVRRITLRMAEDGIVSRQAADAISSWFESACNLPFGDPAGDSLLGRERRPRPMTKRRPTDVGWFVVPIPDGRLTKAELDRLQQAVMEQFNAGATRLAWGVAINTMMTLAGLHEEIERLRAGSN